MDIIILKNAVHSHTGLFRIMKFHFKCSRGGTKSSRGGTKSSRGGECPPLPPPKKNPGWKIVPEDATTEQTDVHVTGDHFNELFCLGEIRTYFYAKYL